MKNIDVECVMITSFKDNIIEVDQKLGVVLFGGNHTNASKSNIAYPASIAGISTGNFDDVNIYKII